MAYSRHYDTKDLEGALKEYERLIQEYPDSQEAGYARTQIANIEEAKNPTPRKFEPATFEGRITERFHCSKCESNKCVTKRIATTGAGLSRLFDVQNNFFLAVGCGDCGHTELYDLKIIEGNGGLTDGLLDVLFGSS